MEHSIGGNMSVHRLVRNPNQTVSDYRNDLETMIHAEMMNLGEFPCPSDCGMIVMLIDLGVISGAIGIEQ